MATSSIADTLKQLDHARILCLADPNNLYPQIVPGLAPIIHANAELELRRWGSDFLAETFASPVLASEHKQTLSVQVLDGLKGYLDNIDEDATVVKSAVQIAASIYSFVFRYIISHSTDTATWQKMASIKSSILRRMDSASAGVRICCIKFVQRVVQTQTSGFIADPRRPDQNEVSLALVPQDHPIIPPSNLEAEASGLLDRLLGALQDQSSDALIVTATLNSLGSLVRSRASIANKIISCTLNFNPLKLIVGLPSPKDQVMVRSMARTQMTFLSNIIKKNPSHPLAGRIQQNVERMRHILTELFDETSRKRPAPAEPTDGLSDAKRQRLGAAVAPAPQVPAQPNYPPLPSGPVSFAQLYTLTQDQGNQNFDVKAIPLDLITRLVPPLLASIDQGQIDNAINAVRSRFLSLPRPPPADALAAVNSATGGAAETADDDEDYEPDLGVEDAEQIYNKLDQEPPEDVAVARVPEVALGSFNLPPPPPLTGNETIECSKGAVTRVFGTLAAFDQTAATKQQKLGLNRLAASNHDRDAWITLISRLATRASAGLENGKVKSEHALTRNDFSASDTIREALFLYIIDDFRRRIDVAISWLNEEWYNDQMSMQQQGDKEEPTLHYKQWMLRILDGIVPFLDAKDKLLIRFLSEIPSLDHSVLQRVVGLAKDPERVQLAVNAIHYLVILRPPVRELCIDALEDLYMNYDDARPSAQKLLAKWRPHVLDEPAINGSAQGIKAE